MSPDKSAIDLALSKKYLAWDSSALNDVFTTRGRSIPVIQLRRLYHSDGTEALIAHYKDWSVGMSAYGVDRKRTNTAGCYRLLPVWDTCGFTFMYLSEGLSAVPFRFAWIGNKDLDSADCGDTLAYWLT